MPSLEKPTSHSQQPHHHPLDLNRAKSLSRKHRHYRSSKLLKTLLLNEGSSNAAGDKNGSCSPREAALDRKQLKKYCINKFKAAKDQQKPLIKKKNMSVNLFKREEAQKLKQLLVREETKSTEELPSLVNERVSNILNQQFQSHRSFTPKRRFQIMRINNFKVKTEITEENEENCPNDVSFQQTLKKQAQQAPEKILKSQQMPKGQTITKSQSLSRGVGVYKDYGVHKVQVLAKNQQLGKSQQIVKIQEIGKSQEIKTQQLLGKGLRKCSLSKKKMLVKNPFERHKKQQEALLQQLRQINTDQLIELRQVNTNQLIEFNQSRITQNMQNSFPSLAHHEELSELLAMI